MKKTLSIILAIAMVFSLASGFALPAFAADTANISFAVSSYTNNTISTLPQYNASTNLSIKDVNGTKMITTTSGTYVLNANTLTFKLVGVGGDVINGFSITATGRNLDPNNKGTNIFKAEYSLDNFTYKLATSSVLNVGEVSTKTTDCSSAMSANGDSRNVVYVRFTLYGGAVDWVYLTNLSISTTTTPPNPNFNVTSLSSYTAMDQLPNYFASTKLAVRDNIGGVARMITQQDDSTNKYVANANTLTFKLKGLNSKLINGFSISATGRNLDSGNVGTNIFKAEYSLDNTTYKLATSSVLNVGEVSSKTTDCTAAMTANSDKANIIYVRITMYGRAVDWVYLTQIGISTTYSVISVALNKSTTRIQVNATEALTATIDPTDATNKNVIWSSDNESVATVSAGVVRGVTVGTANITATTEDGAKTASCAVSVEDADIPVSSVELNKTSTSLFIGSSETLTATVKPSDAKNKAITWKSSDENVATVSSGLVKGDRKNELFAKPRGSSL